MSSLFSVSKLLGKSRAKSSKRAAPARSPSFMSSSTGEKEKDATPKSSTLILPIHPTTTTTTTSDASKAGSNTDLGSVSAKETSTPPPVISESIEIIPEINSQTTRVSVEEPGYAIVPQAEGYNLEEQANVKEAPNSVEEPGYDLVLQPEAKSPETEWTELEVAHDERDAQNRDLEVIPLEADDEHNEAKIPQQDGARRSLDEAEPIQEVISAVEDRHHEVGDGKALRTAHEELQVKSRTIEDLLAQNEMMVIEIARLERLKEEAAHEARREKGELLEEINRLKGIIGVERLENRERLASLAKDKEDLYAKLAAQNKHVIQLEVQLAEEQEEIGSQERRIKRLEERLAEGQEEAGVVYTRSRDLEIRFQRYQEDIAEERDRIAEKDSHIRMVEKNNENLASQLVHLQSSLNKTERQNRVFIDQLRRQSNELQASKSGVTRLGLGAAIWGGGLASSSTRIETAVSTIKLLDEEIFQTAAAMTDQLEDIPKRFVIEEDGASAKAEILKSVLGLELVKKLQEEAQYPSEEYNPLFIQIALQGCLTASCMRIITSWYPAEWEYGNFLVALYERIRGTGGPEIALNWKKATQQSCIPSTDRNTKLVAYLTEQVQAVLTVCGWSQQSAVEEILRDKYSRNLAGIVSQAIRLNTLTIAGEGREAEAVLVKAGKMFDLNQMQNDTPFDNFARKLNSTAPPDEEVVCTTALGLKMVEGISGESEQILLKPKVFLNGGLL